MSVSYNTEHKNYMVFKILEANNKIINMPDGDRIVDICRAPAGALQISILCPKLN